MVNHSYPLTICLGEEKLTLFIQNTKVTYFLLRLTNIDMFLENKHEMQAENLGTFSTKIESK